MVEEERQWEFSGFDSLDERPWKSGGGNGGGRQWNWVVRKTMGINVAVVEEKRHWKFGGFDR